MTTRADLEKLAQECRGEIAKYLGVDSWNFARPFENMERVVLVPLLERIEREATQRERERIGGIVADELRRLRDVLRPFHKGATEKLAVNTLACCLTRIKGE